MLQKLTALVGVNTGQINLNAEAAKRLEAETAKALNRMVADMADTSVSERAEKKSAQAAQITKDMLSKLPELAVLMETKNAALQDSVGAELGSLLGSLEKMAEG